MMRPWSALALCLALPAAAYASSAKAQPRKPAAKAKAPALTTTPSGLQYVDTQVGTGPVPQRGQRCTVHYTGWLSDKGQRGKKFDSSVDRGQPFEFQIGRGMVIKGWDEGIVGMKPGGRRKLTIPADMAYGKAGHPPVIPPDSPLVFDVELLEIVK